MSFQGFEYWGEVRKLADSMEAQFGARALIEAVRRAIAGSSESDLEKAEMYQDVVENLKKRRVQPREPACS